MAYMIQGITNDSVPGVSTPLWIIAGIFMAHILTNEKEEQTSIN